MFLKINIIKCAKEIDWSNNNNDNANVYNLRNYGNVHYEIYIYIYTKYIYKREGCIINNLYMRRIVSNAYIKSSQLLYCSFVCWMFA